MKRKWISFLIVLALISNISISGQTVHAIETESDQYAFKDMPNDWSTQALQNAIKNGYLTGYDGTIMPEKNLTRAQMAAIINRIFGTTIKASLSSYMDVVETEWYYSDMAKAVHMQTFIGSGNRLNPDNPITREEAFLVLYRAFKLTDVEGEVLNTFIDKDLVSTWAKDATASLVKAGYIHGSYDQLKPKDHITRAEFAQIIDNMIERQINKAGVYTEDVSGNVMVNVPEVTLKDMKINGDLVIGDGVGNGDVILDGVGVTGRTVIRGGGINSIKIIGDSNIQNVIVARVDGQVRVFTEEGLEIGEVIIDGNDDVILEGNTGIVTVTASNVTVIATNAKILTGIIEGDHSKIIVSMDSSVQSAEINGENSQVIVEKGSMIETIVINGNGADISGEGEVGKVEAKADNIKVSTLGTKVTANEGTKDVIAGTKTVNEGNTEIVSSNETPKSGSSSRGNGSSTVAVSAIVVSGEGGVTTVTNGASLQMHANITPSNATDKTIVWSVTSLTGGTATINSVTGLLTATGAGTVRVTAANVASGIFGTLDITIALAEEAATPEEYFEFDPSTGTITGYSREGGLDVVIPSTIEGVAVEHIGNVAFNASGGKGDDKPGLTSVVIPNSVISIGEGAFYRNALSAISIPDGVTHIGDYAFGSNQIVEVNLSRSVESIGRYVFEECDELEAFIVAANNSHYSSENGVLFNKDKSTLIQYPYAKAGNYSIPSSVTRIEDNAFKYCTELTGVNIPEGLIHIGNNAFSECSGLTSITLPDSITNLGYFVFSYCTGLTSVTIGNGIDSISEGLFNNCSGLESIVIPDGVTSIGAYAFDYCSGLMSITIPNDVTSIGECAFNGCEKLTSIEIPDHITSIENYTFSSCSELSDITIPNGVTSIGMNAFSYCSNLEEITIPNTVTSIGMGAFTSSGLISITIPDSVISIGRSAFSNCTELTDANVSNSVTSLDEYTFYNCTKLESIAIPNNITSIGNNAFLNCATLTSVTIGDGVTFGPATFIDGLKTTNLNSVYSAGGAGTYIRSGDSWTKE